MTRAGTVQFFGNKNTYNNNRIEDAVPREQHDPISFFETREPQTSRESLGPLPVGVESEILLVWVLCVHENPLERVDFHCRASKHEGWNGHVWW